MQVVITPEEAARLDRTTSIPVDVLMDRAGRGVSHAVAAMGARYGTSVAVLAGPGNNGGDGYVAARYLRRRGVAVSVHALDEPKTAATAAARETALQHGVRIVDLGRPTGEDLIVDALFGGGFRGAMPGEVSEWAKAPSRVISVDIPSGVDPHSGEVDGLAFTAHRTVTFHALKTGHLLGEGPDRSGEVEVVDIGLSGGDPAFQLAEATDALLPARSRTAHKWSAGSVMVVGGAPGMIGASILAARGALHFGAGAVGLAVPDESAEIAMTSAPELLHYTFSDLPERYQVMVIGPGLGKHREEFVRRLLREWKGPIVVDADALAALSPSSPIRSSPTVLTPHAGEFRSLTGSEPRPDNATRLAATTASVVILKGHPTWITDGSTPWAVTTGGPELATIGTGDVLAGMIGALLAAGTGPSEAAVSAAYWHGRAGADLARTRTVTASDLASHVGLFR